MTRLVPLYPFVAFVGFLILPYVHALEFTDGSPCQDLCKSPKSSAGDIAYTLSGELSCLDSDYAGDNSTAVGRKFKSCVSCTLSSGTDNPTAENDLYWFLFNLKSTVVWCVLGFFGDEQNKAATLANSRCNSACTSVTTSLQDKLKVTNETLQYNYCKANNSGFMADVDKCSSCLSGKDGTSVLGNFVSALKSACEQTPDPNGKLSLKADVFEISTPTPSATPSSSSQSASQTGIQASSLVPAQVSTSSSGPTSTGAATSSSSSTLSGGAIGGIVVGALAGLAGVCTLAFLLLRRRKRDTSPAREPEGVYGQDIKGSITYAHAPPAEMGVDTDIHELPGASPHTPELSAYAPPNKP